MGSGKSTLGRQLSAHLQVPYTDNDDTIATLAGTTTLALSQAGGGLLHEWERRYVQEIVMRPGAVIAGIAASSADRHDDLTLLRAHGRLIYLACDVPTLVSRVTADPARPWLDRDLENTLRSMHDRRDPVLRACADLVLDASRPAHALLNDVLEDLGRRPIPRP
jgi:shikimate kinase